jgi:hypothetical protein
MLVNQRDKKNTERSPAVTSQRSTDVFFVSFLHRLW